MAKYNQSKSPVKGWIYAFIAAGLTCLAYAAVFPLHQLSHYLFMAAAALGVGRVAQIMGSGLDTSKSAPKMEELHLTGNEAVDKLVRRGQELLLAIRSENDQIPDEKLSQQIDQMEEVSGRIFRTVIEQPGKAPQIRRFMDYYLPTTQKMLTSYRKMAQRGVQGKEAEDLKEKIESAMGVVLSAFRKQLDTLYQNDILDISTDIDVLETMLRQDSLSGESLTMSQAASGAAAQAKKEE
ncbi:MAG: 5-bromo-4-chloroindolyl phosphate hydrolysis family protein [Christensenellales bacterium]